MPGNNFKKFLDRIDDTSVKIFGFDMPPPDGSTRKRDRSEDTEGSHKKRDQKRTPVRPSGSSGQTTIEGGGGPPPPSGSTALNDVEENPVAPPDGASGETFADKAKKVPKEKFPWALYIVTGEDGYDAISRKHFNAFHRKIIENTFAMTDEESQWINIDFVAYRDTFGVIACTDRYTANWIKTVAASFEFEGHNTKAYNRWERLESWVFQGFLHGESWKKLKGSFVLRIALKKMNLEGLTFTNLTWDTRSPRGVFLAFEPEPRLAAALSVDMQLKIGGQRVILKKRLRKKYTEQEWLKKIEYEEIEDDISNLNMEDEGDNEILA